MTITGRRARGSSRDRQKAGKIGQQSSEARESQKSEQ